jgi:hypothetical protein
MPVRDADGSYPVLPPRIAPYARLNDAFARKDHDASNTFARQTVSLVTSLAKSSSVDSIKVMTGADYLNLGVAASLKQYSQKGNGQ